MADITTPEVRSRVMSRIRGKHTAPELQLRRALFERGFRFRLHDPKLPGSPDIVLRKYKAVIFVHGCFWHGHGCPYFRWPSTREDFWRAKIIRNREVDAVASSDLHKLGWRVMVFWECALRGRSDEQRQQAYDAVADWLRGDSAHLEIDRSLGNEGVDERFLVP